MLLRAGGVERWQVHSARQVLDGPAATAAGPLWPSNHAGVLVEAARQGATRPAAAGAAQRWPVAVSTSSARRRSAGAIATR